MLLRKRVLLLTLLIPLLLPAGVYDYREHSIAAYTEDCKILQTMYARDPENLDILEQIIKMQYALEDFPSVTQNCALYLNKKKSKEIHYLYILSLSLQSQYDRASQEFSLYRSLYKIDDKENKVLSDKIAIMRQNTVARAYPAVRKAEWGTGKYILCVVPGSDLLLGYDTIDESLFAYSVRDNNFTSLPALPVKTDYSKAISLSFSDDLKFVAGSFKRGDRAEILISSRDGSFYSSWQRPAALNVGERNSSAVFVSGSTLLFVSDRADKNFEVYFAKKLSDNEWSVSPVEGLSTPYDESSITLSYDKKTIYFSSNAYGGTGGFEVYSAPITFGERARVGEMIILRDANSFRNGRPPVTSGNGEVYFNHIVSDKAFVYEYASGVAHAAPEAAPPVDTRPEVVARRLLFVTGSAVIERASYAYLNEIAAYLQDNPSKKMIITGHTDTSGTDRINEVLAVERARSVAAYVTSKGITPSRLTVVGKGASSPIASNDTEEGRAQNRRVEIQFTD